MTASVRIWFAACARDERWPAEFVERIGALASAEHVALRITERPEFVAASALAGAWRAATHDALETLQRAPPNGDVLWLAESATIARHVVATLALPPELAVRFEPRLGTLTALDCTNASDPTRRPSLAGFELDWLPPGGGGGVFPGATPPR